ncbi:MAG: hypothetical protein ACK5KT_02250 [Dysgonomonas sp.]
MRNMKKYIFFLPFLFSLILLSSCSDPERTIYEGDGSVQALFPIETIKYSLATEDNNVFYVKVYRGNTKGTVEVPLKLTFAEGADLTPGFKLKSNSVIFQDGSNVADAVIEYDFEKLGVTDVYVMTLALANEDQFALYADGDNAAFSSIDVSVNRRLTFVSIGDGTFISEFFSDDDGNEDSWTVDVQVAEEDSRVYQADFYVKGYPILFIMDDNKENVLSLEKQPIGENYPGYGMISTYMVSSSVNDNKIEFELKFVLPTASFNGTFKETLVLPQ